MGSELDCFESQKKCGAFGQLWDCENYSTASRWTKMNFTLCKVGSLGTMVEWYVWNWYICQVEKEWSFNGWHMLTNRMYSLTSAPFWVFPRVSCRNFTEKGRHTLLVGRTMPYTGIPDWIKGKNQFECCYTPSSFPDKRCTSD